MSDIDTAVVDSLKVLDPNRPIREADNDACFLLPCKQWSSKLYTVAMWVILIEPRDHPNYATHNLKCHRCYYKKIKIAKICTGC